MQAMLLAGGLGTRLRSVVSDRPKPMAEIAPGCPFMGYLVRRLVRQGFDRMIFAVGYKGGMIEDYFGDGKRFGAEIVYAFEEELLGTAGAIRNAAAHLSEDRALVLNADTYYEMDYGMLARMQKDRHLDMALVLRPVSDVSRYGAARLSDGMLVSFNEKGRSGAGEINGGVYMLSRDLIGTIPEGKVSLENEMIPRWMTEGRRIGGYSQSGYFIDIGIPEDLARFRADVKEGTVAW